MTLWRIIFKFLSAQFISMCVLLKASFNSLEIIKLFVPFILFNMLKDSSVHRLIVVFVFWLCTVFLCCVVGNDVACLSKFTGHFVNSFCLLSDFCLHSLAWFPTSSQHKLNLWNRFVFLIREDQFNGKRYVKFCILASHEPYNELGNGRGFP